MSNTENPDVLEGRLSFPDVQELPSRFRRNLMSDVYWALKKELKIIAHEQHKILPQLCPEDIVRFERRPFVKYHCTPSLWNPRCPDTDLGFETFGYATESNAAVDILWSVEGDTLPAYLFRHDDTRRSLHFVALATEDNAHILGGQLAYITAGLTGYLRKRGRTVNGVVSINAEPSQFY
jgi:hypothetical protein